MQVLRIDIADNVAVVVSETSLKKDTILDEFEIKLRSDVSFGDKICLADILKDEPVIRYGETIGYAKRCFEAGECLDENSMYIKKAEQLSVESTFRDRFRFKEKDFLKRTFRGYRNEDGTVGTKNLLAIATTVQCSEGFVNRLIDYAKQKLLNRYPNVDDIVALNHLYGCGVAINAKDSEIPQRTIRNLLKNPNIGDYLMICLGCEKFTLERMPEVDEKNVILQQDDSFSSQFERAIQLLEEKLETLNKRRREECYVSDLKIGLQCGGSDGLSGVTANSVMGYAADMLVQQGASVIFSEVTEVRDAAHLLLERMKNTNTKEKFIREMMWYDAYLESGNVDRSANPSPGNKKGGLSTIIDKAMGSIQKSGTSEIVDVLGPGERIRKKGLSFAATPASDYVCGTEQLASGINLMVFSTGRGTTYNLSQVPVLKLSTNNILYDKWSDLIDMNTGGIVTGESTVEELGVELFELIIRTASGIYQTKAERLGLYNQLAVFNPTPIT